MVILSSVCWPTISLVRGCLCTALLKLGWELGNLGWLLLEPQRYSHPSPLVAGAMLPVEDRRCGGSSLLGSSAVVKYLNHDNLTRIANCHQD